MKNANQLKKLRLDLRFLQRYILLVRRKLTDV
jgi:hypothetical protein